MGIDTVGGTGQQRTVIFSRNDLNITNFIGTDNLDLIHLVGKASVQNRNQKCIAQFHFVQFCKQLSVGQSSVGRQNAVGAFTAHREGCAFQMATGNVQHFRGYTVIQG